MPHAARSPERANGPDRRCRVPAPAHHPRAGEDARRGRVRAGGYQVPAGDARLIDVCLGDTHTVEGSADRGRRPLASGSPRLTGPQPDVSVKGVQGLNCPSESEGPAPAACAPKYAKRQRGSSLSNLTDTARDVPEGSLRLAGTGPTRDSGPGFDIIRMLAAEWGVATSPARRHRLGSFNWPSPGSSRSSTMLVAATPQAGVRGTGRHPARLGRTAQPHRYRARPSRRAKPPRAYLMSLVVGWTARTNRRSPAPHPPRRPPRPGSGLRGFQPVPPCWHSQDARGRRPAPPEPRRPAQRFKARSLSVSRADRGDSRPAISPVRWSRSSRTPDTELDLT